MESRITSAPGEWITSVVASVHGSRRLLTPIGLMMIFVGLLGGARGCAATFALVAFLILGLTAYPPANAHRGARVAMLFAGALGLFVLAFLLNEVWAGAPAPLGEIPMLIGTAMVVSDAAGRILASPDGDEGSDEGTL